MLERTMVNEEYPLFESIVDHVKDGIKNTSVSEFKRWNNDMINATGLEIKAELGTDKPVRILTINFDWDRFKEITLAKQLKLEDHPLFKEKNSKLSSTKINNPGIEIEVMWHITPPNLGEVDQTQLGDTRLKEASKWMQKISHEVNTLLVIDKVITRWHIDIEGDLHGRYISDAMLITYFHYDLSHISTTEDLNSFVQRRINYLMYKTSKIIKIAGGVFKEIAA